MESVFFTVWDYAVLIWNSNFFGFLRFLAGVYTIVLLLDLVLLLFFRDVAEDYVQGVYGADMPSSHKRGMRKRWKKIESSVSGGNENRYKVAILEADVLVDEVLALAKIPGTNIAERLASSTAYQVENKERLLWAHDIRNRIIRDESFSIDKELAEKTIATYRDFLSSWEVL